MRKLSMHPWQISCLIGEEGGVGGQRGERRGVGEEKEIRFIIFFSLCINGI